MLMVVLVIWVDSLLIENAKRLQPTRTRLHKDLLFLVAISIILGLFPAFSVMLFDSFYGWIVFLSGIAVVSAIWGFRHPHLGEIPYVFILMVPIFFTICFPFLWVFVMVIGVCACTIPCLIGSAIGGSLRLLTRHKDEAQQHDEQKDNP